MAYSILIVDGNSSLSSALVNQLKGEFEAEACKLGQQALDRMRSKRPDVVLLDSDLPDIPGMSLLKVMRETEYGKELPVILMAAKKTEDSVVEAFGLGVDDYLAKPFDVRELQARLRTILRRRYERLEHWGSRLAIGCIEIDPSQRSCLVQKKRVVLRPREFELLEILMRKAGRVLTRSYLLETVWGMSSSADTRAVDVMVSRLRRALGKRGGPLIETVSKMGYCFRETAAA